MAEVGQPRPSTWRQLEALLAVVSHDLRSPLSAISVGVDALADPELEEDARDRYLRAMRRAVGRAEGVLSDLVDVSRIAAGTFQVERTPVPVEPLLRRAAREHERQAQETGNWILVDPADSVHQVSADADRLLQALDKLISNAMRHARGTGAITLRAENGHAPGGDTVRLWVIDGGPGIPEPEIDQIFDKCWRRTNGRRNGAGLGLALAKGIVEALGGSIHVESSPGKGARFCLELPVAA